MLCYFRHACELNFTIKHVHGSGHGKGNNIISAIYTVKRGILPRKFGTWSVWSDQIWSI